MTAPCVTTCTPGLPLYVRDLVSILFIMLLNQLQNDGIAPPSPPPPKARKFQIGIKNSFSAQTTKEAKIKPNTD